MNLICKESKAKWSNDEERMVLVLVDNMGVLIS